MTFPVVKGVSYALIHAPQMLLHQGTTQTMLKRQDPNHEHLQKVSRCLRSFEDVVAYPPNQAFIGNLSVEELDHIPRPWYKQAVNSDQSEGRYGAILAEDELLGLVKAADVFSLVVLEDSFQHSVHEKLKGNVNLCGLAALNKLATSAASAAEINNFVTQHGAEPLYFQGDLVGCVKKAHEFDHALSSTTMLENLVSKATAAFALQLLFSLAEIKAEDLDYIIEASEESCGDMNQRGGGSFAKAIGEMCGCVNATGSDTRSFCAAPVHAIIKGAALVKAGVYNNVVVVAGGSVAKLGMNSREHMKKEIPVLEDMLGAFAVLISKNDGINPVIRTDNIGRLKIGSGSSPQATMGALVMDPLAKLGYSIADVDRFAGEMHNPDITEPAGAGNVPLANYKMIAALGVQRGEFSRESLMEQVNRFGVTGFAPTQGHIPSGIPFIGHCREMLLSQKIERGMIIGKGSLFLGRLTNLFDGVS
ncbi:MAG: glycine/sarcosine/betaine reductase complex component C subunit beta, partial [Firmicutes bacterium]|nr:glycine/sarcosine/betaine reductase complex component C subunit beta [Bacillota bacterium]